MAEGHDAAHLDPLHQFEVFAIVPLEIAGLNISITNATVYMSLVVASIILFFVLATKKAAMVPGRFQSLAEVFFDVVAATLKDTVGKEGRKYFPFIFSIFIFVLFANLFGMLPFVGYTVTSQIIVTFALSMLVFFAVTMIAIARHGTKFLGYFVPEGVPWPVLILLVPIEIFSYLIRPITLAVRLAANMTAGHLLLKVIAILAVGMGLWGGFPLLFVSLLVGYEFFVALLQAYIFTILTCVYLHDAVHLH